MKTLAIPSERMHKAAARAAATIVMLAALAAGCGGPEPAGSDSSAAAAPAAAEACGEAQRDRADCAPRSARTLPRSESGAPVYDVYADGDLRGVPALEVAALEPPPNELTKMRLDVDLKLEPAVLVPAPVRANGNDER